MIIQLISLFVNLIIEIIQSPGYPRNRIVKAILLRFIFIKKS